MTAEKLISILGAKKIVHINIFKFEGNYHLRINDTSKKVKKFINRTFGTGKQVSKALMKNGIKEGLNVVTLEDFVKLLQAIENKNLKNRSLKFLSKAEYSSLDEIEWEKFPSRNKKTRSAVRRALMKVNHKWLADNNVTELANVDFGSLPIQGFKDKEISKYFD